jgi:hypothetical protein
MKRRGIKLNPRGIVSSSYSSKRAVPEELESKSEVPMQVLVIPCIHASVGVVYAIVVVALLSYAGRLRSLVG